MSTAARKRELRAAAKAAGVCARCLARPATHGARLCDKCWEKWYNPLPVMRMLCGGEPRCQCLGCGQLLTAFLSIDHIGNDGYAEKHPGGARCGPAQRLAAVRREPHRFQVLCFNCNCAKGTQGKGKCPYEGTPH